MDHLKYSIGQFESLEAFSDEHIERWFERMRCLPEEIKKGSDWFGRPTYHSNLH
jgi:hypothetical protein